MNTYYPERKPLPENVTDDLSQIINTLRALETKLAQTSAENWTEFSKIAAAVDVCRLDLQDYGIRTKTWTG